MSMIVTTVIPGAIVMAADSACSMITVMDIENLLKGNIGAAIKTMLDHNFNASDRNTVGRKTTSRSFSKLYVMRGNNIAVSTGNEVMARSDGLPIKPAFEHFCISNHFDNPKSAAEALLQCISKIDTAIDAKFHVCGFNFEGEIPTPEFWYVNVRENKVMPVAVGGQGGICFSGANNYFSQYKKLVDKNMMLYSVQDAVDLSMFAIEMSMKLERFIELEERITSPIDALVITEAGVEWVSRKKLEA